MKKMNKKGFTIVELVIVIAVIAILAAVLIPTFSGIIEKANNSAALQEARNRYTTYTAEFDYSTGEIPAQDVVIEVNGKWVVVKDAQMQDDIYKTLEEAKSAAKEGNADDAPNAKVLCEEHVNEVAEGGTDDDKCDNCGDPISADDGE